MKPFISEPIVQIRKQPTREAGGSSDLGSSLFIASTPEVARDGDVIVGPWDLRHYSGRNSPILWAHDSKELPIGRGEVEEVDGVLRVRIHWDAGNPKAREVAGSVRRGMLSAVSIGWRPGKMTALRSLPADHPHRDVSSYGYLHEQPELLEVSVVPVPADPRALVLERSMENEETPPAPKPADGEITMDAIRELIAAALTAGRAETLAEVERMMDDRDAARAAEGEEPESEPEPLDPPAVPDPDAEVKRAWRSAGWIC